MALIPTLTSNDFSGLLNQRFFNNFLPVPATNLFKIGQVMPDFELLDITHDQKIRLSSYQGRCPVVLAFTRIFTEKQYCPLCFPHIKELNEAYEQFQQQGAEVLLITSTDEAQSKKVVKDLGLKMPLLSNPGCDVFQTYQVGQALGAPLPAQFVLDSQGRLQFKHLFSFLSNNASIAALLQKVESL